MKLKDYVSGQAFSHLGCSLVVSLFVFCFGAPVVLQLSPNRIYFIPGVTQQPGHPIEGRNPA